MRWHGNMSGKIKAVQGVMESRLMLIPIGLKPTGFTSNEDYTRVFIALNLLNV
jgi:hypothetical protein